MGSARCLVMFLHALKSGSPSDASFYIALCVKLRIGRSMHNPAISLYLEHLLWFRDFTDLVVSHFPTNLPLGKKGKQSRLPENSEALMETFQALSIRETFTIKSTDNKTKLKSACNSLCFKNSADCITDAQ